MASFIVVVAMVGIIDVLLAPFMERTMGYVFPNFVFTDILLLLTASSLGLSMTKKLDFPIWSKSLKGQGNPLAARLSLALGLGIVLTNVLIFRGAGPDVAAWLSFQSLHEPILLSLRAALVEEIIFRFFIFSALTWLFNKFIPSFKRSMLLGALLSSVLFALYHTGFVIAFIYGAALCYIFFNAGLLPAMLVHFLADAIPFTQVFLESHM